MLLNGLSHFPRSSVAVNCFDVDLYVAVEAVYCNMDQYGISPLGAVFIVPHLPGEGL